MSTQTVVDVVVSGSTATVVDTRVDGVTTVAGAAPITNVSGQVPDLGVNTDILATQGDVLSLTNDVANLRANLIVTGTNLTNEIGSLSGTLISTGNELNYTISTLSGELIATGNSLDSLRNLLSGELLTTGQRLQNQVTANEAQISTLRLSTGELQDKKFDKAGGSISGNVLPISSGTLSLGSPELPFLSGFFQDITISSNTLFIGDVPIHSSNGGIDFQSATGETIFKDVTIRNLTVTGTETIIDVENLAVKDNTILINSGEAGAGITQGSGGLIIDRGSLTDADILFNEENDRFEFNFPIAVQGSPVVTQGVTGSFVTQGKLTETGNSLDSKINTTNSNVVNVQNSLAETGTNLNRRVNSLSGDVNQDFELTGVIIDSISGNLITTGANLQGSINTIVSNLSVTGQTLQTQITSNAYDIGQLDSRLFITGRDLQNLLNNEVNTVANNLISTGNLLNSEINTVSGLITDNDGDISDLKTATGELKTQVNATDVNLINTGQYLTDEIAIVSGIAGGGSFNQLSGKVDDISGNLITTGQTLQVQITSNDSDISTLSSNLISTGNTLSADIATVSGIATGNSSDPALSGKVDTLSGNLITTGQTLQTQITSNDSDISTLTSNLGVTGQTLQTQITSNDSDISTITSNLATTGQTLQTQITSNDSDISTLTSNLITTGQTLTSEIAIVSGLTTGSSSDPALSGKVDTLSGNLITTGQTLQTQITSNDSDIASLTSNLATTGQTLTTDITTVSGLIVDNDGDITALKTATGVLKTSTDSNTANLITTGQTLQTQITSNDGNISTLTTNLGTTGQTLQTQINSNDSDISTLTSNLITTGQTLTTDISAVSGLITNNDADITALKSATGALKTSTDANTTNLITTGQTLQTQITSNDGDITTLTSNLVTTGQTLQTQITSNDSDISTLTTNVGTTGQTLQAQIASNDSDISTLTSNLVTTGQTLTTNINTVATNLGTSGQTLQTQITSNDSDISTLTSNLGTTGQTLQTQITSNDSDIASLTTNLGTTGQTLQTQITSNDSDISTLDSTTVKLTTNQSIAGNKIFTNDVTINNLTVTGTEVVVDVENLAVKDNIIEINSGESGAGISRISGGIVIDRGTATNANILYNDANDRFELNFPLAVEGEVVASASNLITTGQTLTTNINTVSTNLGTSGQTLQTQITSNDSDISTLTTNLGSTGQTLQTQITSNDSDVSTLTTNLGTTGQTLQTQITSNDSDISTLTTNLGTTGQTLQTQITSNDSDITTLTSNLVTTGQTLTTNINTVSTNLISTGKVVDGISGDLVAANLSLQSQITSNDTDITNLSSNLVTTGQTLTTNINTVATNLVTTGQTLTSEIATVSGLIPATVVDGAGTSGYTARWFDGNTLTTGALYDSGTRVGIGTNAPDYTLDVAGNIGVDQKIYHNGDPTTFINFLDKRFKVNVGGIVYLDCDDSTTAPHNLTVNDGSNNVDFIVKGTNNNQGNPLFKTDASTNRVGINGVGSPEAELEVDGTILATGPDPKIGIGTITPASLLHVYGADPVLTIQDSESTVANASAIFRIGESDGSANLNNNFNIKFVGTASGGDLDISRYNSTTLANQGIRIKHDGNVGIGDATPDFKLDVAGAGRFAGDNSATPLTVNGGTATLASIQLNGGTNAVDNSSIQAKYSLVLASNSTNGISNRSILFKNGTTEQMRIAADGNVGIGTDAPASLLHVFSASSSQTFSTGADELIVEGSDHAGISILAPAAKRAQLYFNTDAFFRWVDSDGVFTIDTSSSSSKIAIAPGGSSVGVGTNAPSSKLHVNSEISCGADDNNRAMFGYTPSRFYLGTRQSGTNYLNTVNVTSGKVGIGVVDPDQSLEVAGAIKSTGAYGFYAGRGDTTWASFGSGVPTILLRGSLDNSRAGAVQFKEYDGTDTAAIYSTDGTDGYGLVMAAYQGDMKFATGSLTGYKMVILSGGSVGIGTNSPVARLHVHETTAGRIQLTNGTSNATASDGLAIAAELSTRAYFWLYENAYMQFATNNAERMRITADGKVGIGTNAPATTLEASGTIRSTAFLPKIQLKRTGNAVANGDIEWLGNDDSVDWSIRANYDSGGDNFNIKEGSTSRLYIKSGKVGIGTNAPSAKLHVADGSNTTATKIRVDGGSRGFTLGKSQTADHYAHLRPIADTAMTLRVMPNGTTTRESYVEVWNKDYETSANSTSWHRGMFYIDTSSNVYLRADGYGTAGSVFIGTENNTQTLCVKDGGSVGIGTASPTARLNVKASGSTVDQIAVTHSGNTVEIAQLGQSANGNSGGALLLKNNGGTDKIYLDAAGSSYLSGGSVGIGTNNPSVKLHVGGTGDQLYLYGGATNNIRFYNGWLQEFSTTGGSGITSNIYYDGSYRYRQSDVGVHLHIGNGEFDFRTSASGTAGNVATRTQRMVIANNGKVGIGTNAPDGTLHVHTASAGTVTADIDRDDLIIENSTNVGLTFLSPNTAKGAIAFGDPQNSRVGTITYDHSNDSLAIRVNNTDNLFKIASGGAITFNNAFTFPTSDGSSGQTLQTDGSGNVTWSSAGTGTISGSGTDNYIPRFNGTSALENSAIYDNGSEKIGIITTSPVNQLHVGDGTDNNTWIGVQATAGYYSGIKLSRGTGSWSSTANNNFGIIVTDAGISISKFTDPGSNVTGRGDYLTVVNGGSVGIGTVAPDNPLEVFGADSGIKISSASNNRPHLRLECGTAEKLRLSANTVYGAIGDSSDTNRYMVFKDGNIGIATVTPGVKLHVAGQGLFANNGANIILANSWSSGNTDVLFGGSGVSTGSAGNTAARIRCLATAPGGAATGSLTFTVNSGDTFVDALYIKEDGNIGIGTPTPTVGNLQLRNSSVSILALTRTNGSTTSDMGIIRFGNTDIDSNLANIIATHDGATNSAKLVFQTQAAGAATATRMTIKSDGNVGIGTNAPAYLLDLYKSSGTNQDVFAVRGATSAFLVQCSDLAAANPVWNLRTFSGEDLAFKSGNSETVRIKANGNVGIGTNAPVAKLTLPLEEENGFKIAFKAASGDGHAGLSTVDQSGAGLMVAANTYLNASGTPVAGNSSNPSLGIYFDGWSGDRMKFVTAASGNPAERMCINAAGKVIINDTATTNNNNAQLYVNGPVYGSEFDLPSGGVIDWANGDARIVEGLTSNYSLSLQNYDGSSAMVTTMFLESGGNVGIGTNSPNAHLKVQSASGTDVLVRINTGGTETDSRLMLGEADAYGMTFEYDGVSNIGYLGMNDNVQPTGSWSKRIQMSRAGTEVAFMAGNVGIGSASPGGKLHVYGGTTAFTNLSDNTDSVQITRNASVHTHQDAKLFIYDNSNADWAQKIELGTASYGLRIGGWTDYGVAVYQNTKGLVFSTRTNETVINDGAADYDFRVEGDTDDYLLFTEGSTDRVAISTTAPAAKLHVEGDFKVGTTNNGNWMGYKDVSLNGNTYTTALTINLNNHTGCYVKLFLSGDWSSHSAVAFVGEYFVQNGGDGYAEPGTVISEFDNTNTDSIESKIVDPSSDTFTIQLKLSTAANGTLGGKLSYHVMGMATAVS